MKRLQDAAVVSEQKEEGWVPKVGSRVFVPRLGGDAKVRACCHLYAPSKEAAQQCAIVSCSMVCSAVVQT